jgi:hypothetical protein
MFKLRNFRPSLQLSDTKSIDQRSCGRLGTPSATRITPFNPLRFRRRTANPSCR